MLLHSEIRARVLALRWEWAMRYFGSKDSVSDEIVRLTSELMPSGSVCDPFGGIGTMGVRFKHAGYKVCTGDHLVFPHMFQVARIELTRALSFETLARLSGAPRDHQTLAVHLNSLAPRRGWVTRRYSESRGFFTRANSMKIDAIWEQILMWRRDGLLSPRQDASLTASLIDSADRVANTAGTYYAYLTNWHRKALRPFEFRWITPTPGSAGCHSHLDDALETAAMHPVDVLYLDPPYNARHYGDYYHLPESIAVGFRGRVTGLAGIPQRERTLSAFSNKSSARSALSDILNRASWRCLVLHYSDTGLMSTKQIREIIGSFGSIKEYEIKARGYSTVSRSYVFHRIYVVEHS